MSGAQARLEESLKPKLNKLFDGQFVVVTGSYYASEVMDIPEPHKSFQLLIAARATGTPTSLAVDVQFTFDGGANWFDPDISPWEGLGYSLAEVGTGTMKKWISGGQVSADQARLRLLGVGAGVADNFRVDAWLRTT